MKTLFTSASTLRHRQNGVVLIISLIVLVAMTLAGIALLRSVDIATLIAGNLAFRHSSAVGADAGLGAGRKFLLISPPDLTSDHAPTYYSSWNGGATGVFNPATFANWPTAAQQTPIVDAANNSVIFVIHRMCDSPGKPGDPGVNCITSPSVSVGGSTGVAQVEGGGGGGSCPPGVTCAANPYYRITARSTGARNAVTYTQAVIY